MQKAIYKLTGSGAIPFSKPNGKKIFFEKEKLDNWILGTNKEAAKSHIAEEELNHG